MAAHDAWRWLHKAVRGERVPSNMRSEYDKEDVYGPGSTNIRSMHAANDLWHCVHHDRSRLPQVKKTWMTALTKRNWWDIEPYSKHRYGVWIWEAQILVWAAGVHLRDEELRKAAAENLNTCHVLLALSAGWEAYTPKEDNRQHGYRTTMTGARSWVGDRPGGRGSYRDGNGHWYRPYELDYSPLDNILWWVLGKGKPTGERKDVVNAVLTVKDPRKDPDVRGAAGLLEALAAGPDKREEHLAALNKLPGLFSGRILPKVPCVVLRTPRAVAFIVEKSINPGSTHFRYGQVWSDGPIQFDSDYAPWKRDKRAAWLVADDTMRQHGKSGKGQVILEGGRARLRCQRDEGTAWHPVRGQQPGWNEVAVPGEVYSAVRIGPRGVDILVGNAGEVPGPGPGPEPEDPDPGKDKDKCENWPFLAKWLCKLFEIF